MTDVSRQPVVPGSFSTREIPRRGETAPGMVRDDAAAGAPVPTKARSRVVRGVYLTLGILFIVVAVIGIVLPLIPTTGPVLAAGFFFARSSERFDNWLASHRLFGPIIRDWRAGLGFSPKLKTIAIAAITVTFTITVGFTISAMPVRVGLVVLAMALIAYILSLPTKRESPIS